MPSLFLPQGGFVKARVKKILGGGTFEKTFDSAEMVEVAEIEREKVQYTWEDTHEYVFMDMTTFEEKRVPKEDVAGAKYMEEGTEVKLQVYDGKIIGKDLIDIFIFVVRVIMVHFAFAKRFDRSIILSVPPTVCYSKYRGSTLMLLCVV